MYLEDYQPGDVADLGPIDVDLDEVIEFGRRYDPQPFHVDPVAAAAGPFGGIIASGWHTCAMMMRLMVDGYLSSETGLGSPGVDEIRWLAPVRPGDQLRVRVTVLSARASRSKPDRGILQTEIVVRNQSDVNVMRMLATHLLRRRPDAVPQTIVGGLESDHRAIQALLANPAAAEHSEEGSSLREELVTDLVRHLVAEEQYLYPAVREHLAGGDRLAEEAFDHDRACERALRGLEGDEATPQQTATALAEVQQMFAAHVSGQETTIFPALTRDCEPALLVELAEGVRGAEQLAPTRPRHLAFTNLGLNKVSSFVAGYVDHVLDYYRGRGVAPDGHD
jgi:acyl dehydratase